VDAEITRLGLPRGEWQKELLRILPEVKQVTVEYPDQQTMIMRGFTSDLGRIVSFSMSFLYGCRGVLISHGMEVTPIWRGKGIATRIQPLKERIAKDLRASLLLATVRADNDAEKAVIKYWHLVDTFTNERTGNKIEIYTKVLQSPCLS
jgi:hypothetical protein